MDGIGKTTIATVLYDRISYQFDIYCFVENESKTYRDGDAMTVQKQILHQTFDEKVLETLLEFIGNATEFATDFSVAKKLNFATDFCDRYGKKEGKNVVKKSVAKFNFPTEFATEFDNFSMKCLFKKSIAKLNFATDFATNS